HTANVARVADATAMAAALQSALVALLGTNTATVAAGASAGDFVITLQSNLYLAWDSAAGVAGIGVKVGSTVTSGDIDSSSIKLNATWTATPNANAQSEIGIFSADQVPNVRVRIYTLGTAAVVVDESHNGTSVA